MPRKILTSALVAVIVAGGLALAPSSAQAATTGCTDITVTATDGGARVTGKIVYNGTSSYTATLTLKDLKPDGYGATGQLSTTDKYGATDPSRDRYFRETDGSGQSKTFELTGSLPSGTRGVYIGVGTGPSNSAKYAETAKYYLCG